MSDPLIRGLVALAVIGAPILVVWLRSRPGRVRSGQVPSDLGPFPSALLFSSSTCPTCPPAKDVVAATAGSSVREFRWPEDTVAFHKLGVGEVPATFVVDEQGTVVELFRGVPEERRLLRALTKAGVRTAQH